ncbi:uncharacterized protein [Apostichopus japonicus]|uniref:uncharacterized protein isoform X2 n=1 Tax=Stichopus japonicus TaxID=307972 RepID=UPI003AB6DEBD
MRRSFKPVLYREIWKCYLELIVVKISAKCRRHGALACWDQSVFGVVCFCAKPTRHGALACWNQTYTSLDTNTRLPSTLSIHSVSLQKEFLFFPSAVLGCRLILSGNTNNQRQRPEVISSKIKTKSPTARLSVTPVHLDLFCNSGGGRGIGHSCARYQRLEVLCSGGLHSRFQ